jgi:hypothetical protein
MITTLGVPLVPRRLEGRATQPPPTGPLVDSYGRLATDLRVSLTTFTVALYGAPCPTFTVGVSGYFSD